jgi:hypothetical protein
MALDVRVLSDNDLIKLINKFVDQNESEFKIAVASKEAERRGILNQCKLTSSN